ncbi:MAG: suppressor of fused domain protein [Kofleriaceae bacterium]|nr:suppressor of fused domain protein [Kofleriaceae bacterium]
MGLWPFGKKTRTSTTVTEMTIDADTDVRELRTDVVDTVDNAIASLGGEVMHAIDPRRLLDYPKGPAVWSVGVVKVTDAATPYTLLVTYGFSHAVSPVDARSGVEHEYSIAVPADIDPTPWADALLRHLTNYIRKSGKDLAVGDILPCYAPITCVPFPPEHHAQMVQTALTNVVVTIDPVLPSIATEYGNIEVRRFVGVDDAERDRIETWSASAFIEEYLKRDPLLLTDLKRESAMQDMDFRTKVDARAKAEGSTTEAILLDVYWSLDEGTVSIEFPGGDEAAKLMAALEGRLPFNEQLVVLAHDCTPIIFRSADEVAFHIEDSALVIEGKLGSAAFHEITKAIRPGHSEPTAVKYSGVL